ncbi:AAA family ATPase [Olivibacter sp. CPCC 100613]|uniref:AAA family ATPase n=1 Tax=Olivibacter sp. CPCC 100613 TaxID=3079931 RepID=UPI002FFB9BFC
MKLQRLTLKNIGPFLDDSIDFATFENSASQVTILTGENGTGKTVIIDAIRKALVGTSYQYKNIRSIRRSDNFLLELLLAYNQQDITLECRLNERSIEENFQPYVNGRHYNDIQNSFSDSRYTKGNLWIANYWTSQNDHSPFHISSLDFIKPEDYLQFSLTGIQNNAETTKIATFFDYYKSSDDPNEKLEGEFIFNKLKEIFKISLYNGEFVHVERKNLLPIIEQNGFKVSLEKLSSGNLYLVQRLVSLLSQMYSVYKLNNLSIEELCNTPGILLIDEAENHLHPKWQRTFLNSILTMFPNLQIIVATHSPFIVGSVEGSKVYVCKPHIGYSVISDETDIYSNKPINEILSTEVFGETSPFANEEIDKLLEARKNAIEQGNKVEENRIEEELLKINPQYFSYLDIDKIIEKIKKK